jgi:chromosome segregation protein
MLGLREYELKKEEAERRLKNTKINLDKVQALVEEIMPHLRSLTRQTNRWEKRESIAAELKELEDGVYGSVFAELHAAQAEADKRISEHATLKEHLTREQHEAERHLKDVEAKQPKEREELTRVKRSTRELLDERNGLQKEIGRLEAELAHSARSVHSASVSAGALTELLKRIKTELEYLLSADHESARAGIARVVREVAKAIGDSSVSDDSGTPSPISEKLKKELGTIHEKLSVIERDMKAFSEQEQSLERAQEGFYATFKEAVARFETAKDNSEKWETAHREIEFAKERIGMRREEWERQVKQAGRDPREFGDMRNKKGEMRGDTNEAERRMLRLRGELASIGEIDEAIVKEARETETRYEFLKRESADLEKAKEDLRKVILDLQEKIATEFNSALHKINKEFQTFFELMFDGGHARLILTQVKSARDKRHATSDKEGEIQIQDAVEIEEDEEPVQGIEIEVKLPKKRISSLDVLSGGERSLVGIAALFALISVSPPPFLVLDEVDAPLDERNAKRFAEMLKRFSEKTQFILVTHNRATMEAANVLYGMTMNEDGTSKVVSLKLSEYTS